MIRRKAVEPPAEPRINRSMDREALSAALTLLDRAEAIVLGLGHPMVHGITVAIGDAHCKIQDLQAELRKQQEGE